MVKKENKLTVFADGGARGNPGPSAWAFVVKNPNNDILVEKAGFFGNATNNVAEYKAVLAAFSWLVANKSLVKHIEEIVFFLDSQLVVNQLSGSFKIKNENLRKLVIEIKKLEAELKIFIANLQVIYNHIPREENKHADSLLNKALDEALSAF